MAHNEAALQEVAKSNADFSRNFYKVLQSHEGNLVASPLSAQLVLVLAQLGARGVTAQEMKTALALPDDVETIKNGFHALMSTLKASEKVTLEIANRMYIKTGFDVDADFMEAAQKAFESTVESVEFVDPAVRLQINKWVEDTTHDKIKNLIPDGILDNLTRLVLVNAIYFKGPWLHPFNPASTRPMPFYTDETNSVDVPFMYKKAHYGYGKLDHLDAEIVELPYEGRQLSLVILLPRSRTGLAALEAKMNTEKLSEVLQKAHNREIELFLPKFKLESTLNLNDYLKKMGMTSMFSSSANFSGISALPLQVSHVLQKTFIEVSEEGTEAAAATGMFIRTRMLPMDPPPVVQADKPFLFFLVQRNPALAILFGGHLLEPTPLQ